MKRQRVGRWVKSAMRTMVSPITRLELAHLLVRQLEEFVEQAQLVHHLERRGVDGVAAKVAQEVRVLLQDDDVDAGARQQEAEHHAGRPAAARRTGGADSAGGGPSAMTRLAPCRSGAGEIVALYPSTEHARLWAISIDVA